MCNVDAMINVSEIASSAWSHPLSLPIPSPCMNYITIIFAISRSEAPLLPPFPLSRQSIDTIRSVFDAFLFRFPLCYGYWNQVLAYHMLF